MLVRIKATDGTDWRSRPSHAASAPPAVEDETRKKCAMAPKKTAALRRYPCSRSVERLIRSKTSSCQHYFDRSSTTHAAFCAFLAKNFGLPSSPNSSTLYPPPPTPARRLHSDEQNAIDVASAHRAPTLANAPTTFRSAIPTRRVALALGDRDWRLSGRCNGVVKARRSAAGHLEEPAVEQGHSIDDNPPGIALAALRRPRALHRRPAVRGRPPSAGAAV